jgi:hypothetical protein
MKPAELLARQKAYRQLAQAYEADPAQKLFIEQIRRDTESAHRWLQQQKEQRTF